MPIANISRIIKTNLPKEVKLSKEAKETFQECVSEFISFIASEASDKCLSDKRKTINGDDLIHGLSALGFDHYKNILKVYLDKHKESVKLNPATTSGVLIGGNNNNVSDIGIGGDKLGDNDGDIFGKGEGKCDSKVFCDGQGNVSGNVDFENKIGDKENLDLELNDCIKKDEI